MTGGILTNNAKNVLLNRAYKSSPDYTQPDDLRIGLGTTTPVVTDTAIEIPIPIENGTVNDDGDNQMTGSSGGTNTTDNTTTYKEGAGVTDATSQNLIANNTNATKIWTIADLSANGTNITAAKPFALWLYIKDATALAKFKTSGTALEVKLGSDTSNYYSKTWEVSDLAVGWNWISSGSTNTEDLDETGTVSGAIDTFIIEITTNNATDTFTTGDVIYDLLRQWISTDLKIDIESGYPVFDETNKRVTIRFWIPSTKANGFSISEIGSFNTDATPKLIDHDVITATSKSSTDEFLIQIINKIT